VCGIIDAVLPLLHLGLSGTSNPDDGYAASELRESFPQPLTVDLGGGLLDLHPDLVATCLDVSVRAGTADDGGIISCDRHSSGGAEVVQRDLLELYPGILRDQTAAGEDRVSSRPSSGGSRP
jgi:hypothetical protein